MISEAILRAKGSNGTIEMLSDRVRILRSRWVSPLYGKDTNLEIRIRQIKDVELKTTVKGLLGYCIIHDTSGREAYEDRCVSFVKMQQPAFEALKTAIEARRLELLQTEDSGGMHVLAVEDIFH